MTHPHRAWLDPNRIPRVCDGCQNCVDVSTSTTLEIVNNERCNGDGRLGEWAKETYRCHGVERETWKPAQGDVRIRHITTERRRDLFKAELRNTDFRAYGSTPEAALLALRLAVLESKGIRIVQLPSGNWAQGFIANGLHGTQAEAIAAAFRALEERA